MPQFDLMNLVLTWASHGPGTQLDRVALVPSGAHLILVTVVLFYASPGPSDSVPHLGLHGPSDYGPSRHHWDLDTVFHTWASLSPGTSGRILGLKLNWLLWSPSGPHPYLVTLDTPWASFGPGESGP